MNAHHLHGGSMTIYCFLHYCKKDKSTSNLNTSALQQTSTSDEMENSPIEYDEGSEANNLLSPGNRAEGVYVTDENVVLSPVSPSGSTCSSTVTQTKGTPKTSVRNKRKRGDGMCSIVTNASESIANERSDLPSEIQSFCNVIGHELKAMEKSLLKQVKWQIVDVSED